MEVGGNVKEGEENDGEEEEATDRAYCLLLQLVSFSLRVSISGFPAVMSGFVVFGSALLYCLSVDGEK